MSKTDFYLAAWSDRPASGIYRYRLTPEGRPALGSFQPLPKAGYLAWSPDRRFLYSTCSLSAESDSVAAFAVDAEGDLRFLNSVRSGGRSCCHLTVSPDGQFVYAANYFSATFAEFKLNADGSIAGRTRLIRHEGSGPNLKRQEMPHPHFTGFTPDGRFVAVIDLGIDAVKCYPYTPGSGIDPEGAVTSAVRPAGSGPRHLAFAPDGRIAYLINELGNTLFSCAYADGRFETIAGIDLLPRGVECATKASAVRMSPDGNWLVATNRGFDSLVLVRLDGRGGMEISDLVFSGGSSPRDVNFLPGGRWFAAAHEFTDNVRFFDFDPERGRLTPNGYELTGLPRPICVHI